MAEQTDRELVIVSKQGSKEAFGYLIERYQAMMRRIALRMVADENTAQDIVQEAMLQGYLSLKDLRNEDSFRSWLYGIVLNVSKSYLREQQRQSRFHSMVNDEQLESVRNANDAEVEPQQVATERELHRLVLLAIEELPPAHRETARMYYYESLTLHEIAAITGASPGAIKVRLHRARNHLRETLHRAYPELQAEMPGKLRRKPMIKAKVADIVKRDDKYIILLQDEAQEKMLSIWVGPEEGTAIAMGLRAFPTPRPMTFDFMAHLLDALGTQLEEARIEVLKGDVFYGVAKIRIGKEVKEVDARPSDVLALAVRTGSPIYVAEEVMHQASKDMHAYENEFGLFTPGKGAEAITKEFGEAIQKHLPASLREKEEDAERPED